MDDTDYTVDKPERIASILRDLDHKLTLVSVRLEQEGPLYNSALVRLDPDQRLLYLDELTPSEGHQKAQPETEIRVFASLRGVAVRFSTRIQQVEQEADGALYACPYPETLQYLQRRDTFRVHIPLSQRPVVELHADHLPAPVQGEMVDLSAQGMCVELTLDVADQLEPGTTLRFENLMLPDVSERLSGDVRLANCRRSARDGHTNVGLQVIGISQWLERQFNVALLFYQREARRRAME